MWNAFSSGWLCTGEKKKRKSSKRRKYWFNKKIKENEQITALNATLETNDNADCYSDVKGGHGNKTDPVKVKEECVINVPEIHDGYMKISDFKHCETFLTQPHAKIPESRTGLKKPDIVYGYITEDENTDDAGKEMQREFVQADESTESMEEVNEGTYVFPSDEHHQMQDLKLNIVRRNSQQSEISTDSGRSSNLSSSSETRLKQLREECYFCRSDCSECRAVYMEYMVDVYEQLIVRQIKVTDIVDFLTVLDDKSKDMLRSKHKQSPHGAMELLIRIIKQSHAPGKWQCFYDAIKASEFTYINLLLNEETEIQYNYSTEVLALIKPELKSRIYVPEFLDKVFERQLVTEEEKDEANSLSDMKAKTYILDKIDKHLPNWNQVLIEVLNDSFMGDLGELFKLVSDEGTAPKLKEGEDRNFRRALRKRRKHIMKIAHGGTSNQSAPKLPSFTNEFVSDTATVGELGEPMEKAVTNLTTLVEELTIRLRDNESNVTTTLLQDVICKQNKLNYQQAYLCSEIQNIRKEMTEMIKRLPSVVDKL